VVSYRENREHARTMNISKRGGRLRMFSKYGGSFMYVEFASHLYRSPSGMGMAFQRASPSKTSLYTLRYCAVETAARTVDSTSCAVGQISRK